MAKNCKRCGGFICEMRELGTVTKYCSKCNTVIDQYGEDEESGK